MQHLTALSMYSVSCPRLPLTTPVGSISTPASRGHLQPQIFPTPDMFALSPRCTPDSAGANDPFHNESVVNTRSCPKYKSPGLATSWYKGEQMVRSNSQICADCSRPGATEIEWSQPHHCNLPRPPWLPKNRHSGNATMGGSGDIV